jgi:hypothetical protein
MQSAVYTRDLNVPLRPLLHERTFNNTHTLSQHDGTGPQGMDGSPLGDVLEGIVDVGLRAQFDCLQQTDQSHFIVTDMTAAKAEERKRKLTIAPHRAHQSRNVYAKRGRRQRPKMHLRMIHGGKPVPRLSRDLGGEQQTDKVERHVFHGRQTVRSPEGKTCSFSSTLARALI